MMSPVVTGDISPLLYEEVKYWSGYMYETILILVYGCITCMYDNDKTFPGIIIPMQLAGLYTMHYNRHLSGVAIARQC